MSTKKNAAKRATATSADTVTETFKAMAGPAAQAVTVDAPPPVEIEVAAGLNAKHAVITMGGNTRILTEQPSLISPGAIEIEFSREADFKLRYANQRQIVAYTAAGKPIFKTAAQIWLEAPSRRQYDRMIFDPTQTPRGDDEKRVYNLWRGFPYKYSEKRGTWKRFRQFIEEVICGGDKAHAQWVIGWMARCVQRPNEPAGVALVLRGEQGIGKGFFANQFAALYDPTHFVAIQKRDHLTGRFNALLRDALLVFVDEAFFAGDPTIKGPLKALITEPVVVVEHKGVDPVKFPNMRAFILASNEALVIPAEMDARRWAVFNVSNKHANERGYFAQIAKELESGGYAAMMHDLLAFDLRGVDPYTAPQTAALAEQKALSLTAAEKFIFDCLKRGEYLTAFDGWAPWDPAKEIGFAKDQAVRSYLEQLQTQRAHTGDLRSAETTLGMAVRRIFADVRSATPRVRTREGKEVRPAHWVLPGLNRARQVFGDRLGGDFTWE